MTFNPPGQLHCEHGPITPKLIAEELPVVSPEPANPLDCFQVLFALGRLDEVFQAAVALFYLEDFAYKDIALILEVPVATVKSRIARGVEQFRRILLSDRSPILVSPDEAIPAVEEFPPASSGGLLPNALPCGIKNG
jgi:hypothetical protein